MRIELTSRFEGQCTVLVSYLQMTRREACSDHQIFLTACGDLTEASALTTELQRFIVGGIIILKFFDGEII